MHLLRGAGLGCPSNSTIGDFTFRLPWLLCGIHQQGKTRKVWREKEYIKKQANNNNQKKKTLMNSKAEHSLYLMGFLFLPKPLLLLTCCESLLPSLQLRASGEELVLTLITSAQVVPPAQNLHFHGLQDRISL